MTSELVLELTTNSTDTREAVAVREFFRDYMHVS